MRKKGINMNNSLDNTINFIQQYINANGFPPTVREIAIAIGVSSTATVNYYLDKLETNGLIKRNFNKNRTIEILSRKINNDVSFVSAPLLGTVSAGVPRLAEESINEPLNLPSGLFNGKDLFSLRVRGDSMIDIGMFENDIVIVKQQKTAKNKDIIVALINDEATVKRVFFKDNQIVLHPENSTMSDMVFDNVEILGLVVGLIRNM